MPLRTDAFSPSLAEGTLFGFRKGAFTGADRDQPGVFEAADGGTLFLDEVGELALDMQVKLLRALDRREITRLGEPGRVRSVDVRVAAATHRDLRQAVEDGGFREDLYYRLARALVRTPPLRERSTDVIELAQEFVRQVCSEYDLQVELSEDAKQVLEAHRWPGNVRELRNVIEQAVHIRRSGLIEASDLRLGSARSAAPLGSVQAAVTEGEDYYAIHAAVDRVLLARLLDEHDHNISRMAARLGISRDERSATEVTSASSVTRGARGAADSSGPASSAQLLREVTPMTTNAISTALRTIHPLVLGS